MKNKDKRETEKHGPARVLSYLPAFFTPLLPTYRGWLGSLNAGEHPRGKMYRMAIVTSALWPLSPAGQPSHKQTILVGVVLLRPSP